MLRENAINILGTLAALALSSLFLARVVAPAETGPDVAGRYAAEAGGPSVHVIPSDAIIIQALRIDE